MGGGGGTFWGNAPMPPVALPLIDTKTKMADLDHLEIPKSTLLQILISKFQWATPFEIHTPPVKDFGKMYLIGSAMVDTTFVDIYVDTKNIPTCRYNIQHIDKRTMENKMSIIMWEAAMSYATTFK